MTLKTTYNVNIDLKGDTNSPVFKIFKENLRDLQKTAVVAVSKYYYDNLKTFMKIFKNSSGKYANSVVIENTQSESNIDVTAKNQGFYYPEVVESGRGEIHPVKKKVLRFRIGGSVVFSMKAGAFKGYNIIEKTRTKTNKDIKEALNASIKEVLT